MVKNWCFWTVVLEKTLESPLDRKDIKPVNPKRNQPWIFIGRTGAEAEALILWLPNERSDSQGKTLMLGKTEGKRRRGWQRIRWLDGTLTQWTWVWARSGRQRRTEKHGVVQFMKSQRISQDLVTEQQLSQRIIRLQRGQLKLAECPFYYMEPQMRQNECFQTSCRMAQTLPSFVCKIK